MASGYVVAAILEMAGLTGLVIAAFRLRGERLAKSTDLRSFLLSGHIPASELPSPPRWARPDARVIAVPVLLELSSGAAPDSPARSALRRAVLRAGPGHQSGRPAPLNAG